MATSDWLRDGFHTHWAAMSVQLPNKIDITYRKLLSVAKWTRSVSFPSLDLYCTEVDEGPVLSFLAIVGLSVKTAHVQVNKTSWSQETARETDAQ